MTEFRSPEPLSSELAQRVVDMVTTRLDRHVNVMDEHGVIIASSDPARVGTLHRAAAQVVAEGRAVTVTVPEAGSSDRPGVNEPLVIDGRLCGVVGVTGDPREVGQLATVVALGVQLLLAQERSYDAATRRSTAARELVAVLTSGLLDAVDVGPTLRAAGLGAGPWTLSVWADPAAVDGARARLRRRPRTSPPSSTRGRTIAPPSCTGCCGSSTGRRRSRPSRGRGVSSSPA